MNGIGNVVPHPAALAAVDPPAVTIQADDFVNPDRLFDSLDGRSLTASGVPWRIEVFSIADADHDRWVQLALCGHQRYLLTLRLHVGDGTQRAVAALAGWLANPSDPAQLTA